MRLLEIIKRNVAPLFAAAILMSAQLVPAFLFIDTVSAAGNITFGSQFENRVLPGTNTWATGQLDNYSEGDYIDFRFQLNADNATAAGTMHIEYDLGACSFFTDYFDVVSVTPSIATVTEGNNTLVNPNGANNDYYRQDLQVAFNSTGLTTVIVTLQLSNTAGECTGSSTGVRLGVPSTGAGDFANAGAKTLPLSANQVLENPSLTITKIVVGGDAVASDFTFNFSPAINGMNSVVIPVGQNSITIDEVNPDGVFTITETGPSGYTFTGGTGTNCVVSNLDAGQMTATVIAKTSSPQNATCNFTNEQQTGQIKVKKLTNPSGDDTDFTFSTSYSSDFVLSDGETNSSGALATGTYTVSETVPDGWDQTNVTCDDGSTPDNIQLDADETVTCVFTNTKRGTLTVEKTTQPAGDQTSFSINASGSGTIIGGGSGTVTDSTDKVYTVTPGTYSVTETVPEGWELVSNSCDDVVVAAGEDETCEIINKKYATFTIIKDAEPNDLQDFVFNGSDSLAGSYTLDDDEGVEGEDDTFSNQKVFTLPSERVYTLTEVADVEGWMLTDVVCEGHGATENLNGRNATFILDPGTTATCTFTNTKLAKILGTKFKVDADGGNPEGLNDWMIRLTNNTTSEETTTATGVDGSYSFEDLLPGDYTVEEILQDGWTQIVNDNGCAVNYAVTLIAGAVSEDNDFCNFQNGSISGYKWNDENGDGNVTGDDKLSGWTIFIDKNGNEALDDGELSTVTDVDGTYTFNNVGPGTYDVCEVLQDGWVQTYPGNSSDPECQPVTIDESGEMLNAVKTRSFGNQGQGTVVVIKDVINDDGGTKTAVKDFTFAFMSGSDWTFDQSAENQEDGIKTFDNVPAGSYSVVENEENQDGYSTTYDNCTDFVVAPGQEVVCTITNDDEAATLIVEKELVTNYGSPAVPDNFSFSVNSGAAIDFESDGSNEISVDAGTYTVVEQDPGSGFETPAYDNCIEVVIPNGGTATCTITNADKPGTLIVEKVLITDDGGLESKSSFRFNVNNTGYVNFDADGSNEINNLSRGNYTVVEEAYDGYTTTYSNSSDDSETCDDIFVANGETETCTITNDDNAPELKLKKVVINDDGGEATADEWTLSANALCVALVRVDPGCGFSDLGDSDQFHDVYANRNYTLTELGPEGYEMLDWSCDGGTQVGNNVSLGLGDSVTCTVTNDDIAPTLEIGKEVINDNGGDRFAESFDLYVNGQLVEFRRGGGEVASNGAYGPYLGAEAGFEYSVTEDEVSGYSQVGSVECIDTDTELTVAHPVTLSLAQNVRCVITNDDEQAYITVNKIVTNDDGGDAQPDDFALKIGDKDVLSGVQIPVNPGSYPISETLLSGYEFEGFSNDCTENGVVDIELGEEKTCTLTNNDIAPTLTVIKYALNDNSGESTATDFDIYLNNTVLNNPSDEATQGNVTAVSYTPEVKANIKYTISEEAYNGYENTSIMCYQGERQKIAGENMQISLTLELAEDYVCVIINDDVPNPAIQVVKDGPAVAKAGDTVTYTFEVTNIGDIPLTDIEIGDTITGTPEYVSGDINKDDYLDLDETWLYEDTYDIPEGQVSPVTNVVTVCGAVVQIIDDSEDADEYEVEALRFNAVATVLDESSSTVCDEDDHTTNIPQVLAEVTPPKVVVKLVETGDSAIIAIITGLMVVTLAVVTKKTIASDD